MYNAAYLATNMFEEHTWGELYRHSSGMGTVMEFNDKGRLVRCLVLDAAYRYAYVFGTYALNTSLEDCEAAYITVGKEDVNTSSGSYATTTVDAASVTDDWFNNTPNLARDNNTSKQNCDVWITYKDYTDSAGTKGVPAVEYCRSIKVNGTPCDLPNVQTIMRIYCKAEAIDELDPTVNDNLKMALGIRNNSTTQSSTNGFCVAGINWSWTSTEYDKYANWYMGFHGRAHPLMKDKRDRGGIIPILELEAA